MKKQAMFSLALAALVAATSLVYIRGFESSPTADSPESKAEETAAVPEKKENTEPVSGIAAIVKHIRAATPATASSSPALKPASTTATTTTAKSIATTTKAVVSSPQATTTPAKVVRKNDLLLSRVEYVEKRYYIANKNLALLAKMSGYIAKQQEFVRSMQNACTGACYTDYAYINKRTGWLNSDMAVSIQNQKYAQATLESYHRRIAAAFANPQVASAAAASVSAQALDSVASLTVINREVGNYERGTSASEYLKRATSIDDSITQLIKKYPAIATFKTSQDALLKERAAREKEIAAWTAEQKTLTCTATLAGDDFKTNCTAETAKK